MAARIDHLVVLAASLAEGVGWCEAALGVTPGPGGAHPLMGTHNRLLRIATVNHPRAYLEIIAIDPEADPAQRRAGARWFDMDDSALQASVRERGPRLVHFVANVPQVEAALRAWREHRIEAGEALAASRMTPRGLLQWKITVRPDGRRLFDGCLPSLIEWPEAHPAAAMPESGVMLQSLSITHPRVSELRRACDAIGLEGVELAEGRANLQATLLTPKGRMRLESATA
ncbi:MAG TPA: VOC family protein [Ramlibacter sp.]|uniref:VOC family protein n=1 Tax=Ramlibacter sp. TaxID=1917967 RepID=UPI002C4FE371|nr:VOC family protein [Ramlibacter sp.]HVZ44125.1 VOC family protein [Ramlibacter sp.]